DAAQPQRDRNLARHHADDGHRNRVRRHLLPPIHEEVVVLPLADVDAAAAAANHYARARLADAQTGVDPGFTRRDDADERRTRVALRVGAIVVVPDIVAVDGRHVADRDALNGRGHAAAEVGRVEGADGARRAAAGGQTVPEPLSAD